MDIETKQIVRGKTKTVAMLSTDLEILKKLKSPNESLTLALHRIILKTGEAANG